MGSQARSGPTADLFRSPKIRTRNAASLRDLLAATVWGQYIANSLVVVFLDNEAARSAYIQEIAATDAGRMLLKQFTAMEAEHNFFPWFGRVRTASNPADPPSRMSFTDAILKTGRRIRISLPAHLENVGFAPGELESFDPAN